MIINIIACVGFYPSYGNFTMIDDVVKFSDFTFEFPFERLNSTCHTYCIFNFCF